MDSVCIWRMQKKYRYVRTVAEKRAENCSVTGVHPRIRIVGGNILFRILEYEYSFISFCTRTSLEKCSVEVVIVVSVAFFSFFNLDDRGMIHTLRDSCSFFGKSVFSKSEVPSSFQEAVAEKELFRFKATTWAQALTPRSVRPHREYPLESLETTSRALTSASKSFRSTELSFSSPMFCARPEYDAPS